MPIVPTLPSIVERFNKGCDSYKQAIRAFKNDDVVKSDTDRCSAIIEIMGSLEWAFKYYLGYICRENTTNSEKRRLRQLYFPELMELMQKYADPPLKEETFDHLDDYKFLRNMAEHKGIIPSFERLFNAIKQVRTLILAYLPVNGGQLTPLSELTVPDKVQEVKDPYFEYLTPPQVKNKLSPILWLFHSRQVLESMSGDFPTMFRKGGIQHVDLEAGFVTPWIEPDSEEQEPLSELFSRLLIREGIYIGVVGPAASGKSTLARTVALNLLKLDIPSVIIPANEVNQEISRAILEYPKEQPFVVILEDLHLAKPKNLVWVWRLLNLEKKERYTRFLLTSRTLDELHPNYPFKEYFLRDKWSKLVDLADFGIREHANKIVGQFLQRLASQANRQQLQQLATKITERHEGNLLLIAFELYAYVETFLPQLMVNDCIHFEQIHSVPRANFESFFTHLNLESSSEAQSRVNQQILQYLNGKVHSIAEKTDVPHSLIQKTLLTLIAFSEREIAINAKMVSNLWNINAELVTLTLKSLEKDLQEIFRKNNGYAFFHSIQAFRFLQAIERDEDEWNSLIVDFEDAHLTIQAKNFQSRLFAVAQEISRAPNEVLMLDDARRSLHQRLVTTPFFQLPVSWPSFQLSLEHAIDLTQHATASELSELIRKFWGDPSNLQKCLALWDELGISGLTEIVQNADSADAAIHLLSLVHESGWSHFDQLMDSIGVRGFADLIEEDGFSSVSSLLAHLEHWMWEKTLLFRGEIFVRSLQANWTDSLEFYHNLASSTGWSSILQAIDPGYIYGTVQENSELYLPFMLEFLDKQAPKLGDDLVQRILEDASQNFPISHLVHCMWFAREKREWNLHEFMKNWKLPILKENLLGSNATVLEGFLEEFYNCAPDLCTQLLVTLPANEIIGFFNQQETWRSHANLLFTLEKVRWPYMNKLLDLLGLEYFVEFIRDSNEFDAVPHVLEFLFRQRWDNLPKLLTELKAWLLLLDPSYYWVAHFIKVLAKNKSPQTEELVKILTQRYVREGFRKQLQDLIRILSEVNWPWKSWVVPSEILDPSHFEDPRVRRKLILNLDILIEENVSTAEDIAKVLFQHYLKEGMWFDLSSLLKTIVKMDWDWQPWIEISDLESLLTKDLIFGTQLLQTLHEAGWEIPIETFNNLNAIDVAQLAAYEKELERGSLESIVKLFEMDWSEAINTLKYIVNTLLERRDVKWLWEVLQITNKMGEASINQILTGLDDYRLFEHLLQADIQYGPLLMDELFEVSPNKAMDLLSKLLDRLSTSPKMLRIAWQWHYVVETRQSLDHNAFVARILDNRTFRILEELPSDWDPYLLEQIRKLPPTQLSRLFLYPSRRKRDWNSVPRLLGLLNREEAQKYTQEFVLDIMERGNAQDLQLLLVNIEGSQQTQIIQQIEQLDPELTTQFILRSEIAPLTNLIITFQAIDQSVVLTFMRSCPVDGWTKILLDTPKIEARWFLSILRVLVPSLAKKVQSKLIERWHSLKSSEYELDMALFDYK